MIIELSEEFGDFRAADWQPYIAAIEHLITAHANGWHILTPSRAAADSILANCGLSDRQRQLLKTAIISRIAVLSGQAKSSDATILAVPTASTCSGQRVNQIVVPLSLFSNMQACLPSQLLTEDSTFDGSYFSYIANIMAKDLGYSLRLNLELVHGGGSGLANRYAQLLATPRPGLCIVDSDIRFPNGPLGNTAKGVKAHGWSNASGTVLAKVLPVREVENTIPITFLLDVYRNDAIIRNRVSRICAYLEKVAAGIYTTNAVPYLDLKEGDIVGKVAQIPTASKAQIVHACRAISPVNHPVDHFDDLSCADRAHEGVAEGMLRATLDFVQANPRFDRIFREKIRKTPFWSSLEDIVRLILAFGAGDTPLASR